MRPIDADALIEFCAERWIPLNIDAVNMQPTIQPEKAQLLREGTTSNQPVATDANVGDTISRQAAIDALKHNQDVYSHNFHDDPIDKYTTAIIATDIDTLVNLPTVQPEPKEGEWEQVSVQRYFTSASYIYRCSACGENNPRNTKYCPNCGADMRGEKDG